MDKELFIKFISVGAGGFIGSVLRYSISLINFNSSWMNSVLFVNLVGSFLIGLFIGLSPIKNNELLALFLIPGLLGGFTTFSAFSADTLNFLTRGEHFQAILYVLISILGGIVMSFLGMQTQKLFS